MAKLRSREKSVKARSTRRQSDLNSAWTTGPAFRAAFYGLWIVFWMMAPGISCAQATPGLADQEKLIAEFTDPLTTLPQISIKDAFTPANFGTHVQTNQFIVRPIIPRLPRFSLFPLVQLIRPSFSLVTVPSARGGTALNSATCNCSMLQCCLGHVEKPDS